MADEILHSSQEADLKEADRIAGAVRMLLADTGSILRVPGVCDYLGSINGFGSDTIRTPYAQHDALAAATEIESVANTALTDTSATVAVSRGALAHQISDLSLMTSRGMDDVSLEFLARKMVGDKARYEMDLLAAVIATFTANVTPAGGSGSNMDVDTFYSAKAQLITSANVGETNCLLQQQQWVDFIDSLRAEGGAVQYRSDVQTALGSTTGQGYVGTYLGVNIFVNDRVDTANGGADYEGAMWCPGAIGYADGDPTEAIRRTGGNVVSVGEGLAIELQRPDRVASAIALAHVWLGVGLLETARGVSITSDV